jgi:hypothetical protein
MLDVPNVSWIKTPVATCEYPEFANTCPAGTQNIICISAKASDHSCTGYCFCLTPRASTTHATNNTTEADLEKTEPTTEAVEDACQGSTSASRNIPLSEGELRQCLRGRYWASDQDIARMNKIELQASVVSCMNGCG